MVGRKIIIFGRQIELTSDKDKRAIMAYFEEHPLDEPGYTGSKAVKVNGKIIFFRCFCPDSKLPFIEKQVFVYDADGKCLSSPLPENACKTLGIPSSELEYYSAVVDLAPATYIDGMYFSYSA